MHAACFCRDQHGRIIYHDQARRRPKGWSSEPSEILWLSHTPLKLYCRSPTIRPTLTRTRPNTITIVVLRVVDWTRIAMAKFISCRCRNYTKMIIKKIRIQRTRRSGSFHPAQRTSIRFEKNSKRPRCGSHYIIKRSLMMSFRLVAAVRRYEGDC